MLIDGNLTLVHKGWALGAQGTEQSLIANTEVAGTTGNSVNMSADVGENRELARGRTLFLVVVLNQNGQGDDADEYYSFNLYTDDSVDSNGNLDAFTNKVGEVRIAGNANAGTSRWIALQDSMEQYLQLRVSSTTGSGEGVQFSSFLSTELPTTTHITQAPYVGYESYSGGSDGDGFGKAG